MHLNERTAFVRDPVFWGDCPAVSCKRSGIADIQFPTQYQTFRRFPDLTKSGLAANPACQMKPALAQTSQSQPFALIPAEAVKTIQSSVG